jgi:deoxyribose-phosphate aldolase
MMGLRQKILSATSEEEVKKLLTEGKTYEFASVKTRNSWQNAARRKAAGEKYAPTKSEQPAKKKKIRRSR